MKRSICCVLLILLLIAGCSNTAPPAPKPVAPGPALAAGMPQGVRIPPVPFTDITDAAGIRFVHVNGAFGKKLLPETMGSGVAFLDYDNDGKQDLLFVNSCYWPGQENRRPNPTLALYHNEGNDTFTDLTKGSGLDVAMYG